MPKVRGGSERPRVAHKKTNVDPSMFEVKKLVAVDKTDKMLPGTLTGDKLIIPSPYSWHGVAHAEMDRLLASGPTLDAVVHRGLPNFASVPLKDFAQYIIK